MRRPHWLAKVKGGELPQAAIWFDTETDQIQIGADEVKHVLRFGWLAYRRRVKGGEWSRPQWLRFETPAEFWDIVESLARPKTRTYMFAHNAGFDLPVVDAFTELPRRGYKLGKAVIDSPPVILHWRGADRTLECLDTLNIWRMPLDALGEQVGLPKLDMPERTATADTWDTYCRRDVEVIMGACLRWWQFLDTHRLGGFAPTLASQALRAFRHRFMPEPIYIDDHGPALALARMAYVGGRTECFRLGIIAGPLYLLDVNSMYPHVMRTSRMPTKLIATTQRATLSDLSTWLKTRCVVAHVALDTDEPAYPIVHDGKLVFPTGRFLAYLSTPELRHALKRGHITHVLEAAVYEAANIFAPYVDELYAMRLAAEQAGDTVTARQAKILLNALYGKFGQRGRVYETVRTTDDLTPRAWVEYDADTDTIRKYRQLGGSVQEWRDEGEARESHPAIAAHVTAEARLYLWQLILAAGRENTYYTDTDSLLVNQPGMDRLATYLDPKTLGALKLEREITSAVIHGPKDYAFDDLHKTKGVRKRAVWVSESCVIQEQWTTLRGLVGRGQLSAPTTKRIAKSLARTYSKGIVHPDGTVSPLHLGG